VEEQKKKLREPLVAHAERIANVLIVTVLAERRPRLVDAPVEIIALALIVRVVVVIVAQRKPVYVVVALIANALTAKEVAVLKPLLMVSAVETANADQAVNALSYAHAMVLLLLETQHLYLKLKHGSMASRR
jgi:Na+/pantothenate symporter